MKEGWGKGVRRKRKEVEGDNLRERKGGRYDLRERIREEKGRLDFREGERDENRGQKGDKDYICWQLMIV